METCIMTEIICGACGDILKVIDDKNLFQMWQGATEWFHIQIITWCKKCQEDMPEEYKKYGQQMGGGFTANMAGLARGNRPTGYDKEECGAKPATKCPNCNSKNIMRDYDLEKLTCFDCHSVCGGAMFWA